MSTRTATFLGAAAALVLASSADAMPMTGTMTGQVASQDVQPLGAPNKLKITETATGTNASPGMPLHGAQLAFSDVVMLINGRGPTKGTLTFTLPTGTTTNLYDGIVTTDAQGRVTVKGTFKTTGGTGAFEGLKGSGTYTVAYTSKTDFTSEWKGNFTPPKMARH